MKQEEVNGLLLGVLNKARGTLLAIYLVTATLLFATTILTSSSNAATESSAQKLFTSPELAVKALIVAVENDNNRELLTILGTEAEDLINSGDTVADHNGRMRFLHAFHEQNSIEQKSEDHAVLIIGSRNYPFPIPIIHKAGGWLFDTQAGMEEILSRRIGRNELHTIDVMHIYTEAQREYASLSINGGGAAFAQKLTSSEGLRDGLFWPSAEGEQESPLGPLIARATNEGYAPGFDSVDSTPFHGYFFKILKGQGEHANGGAFDYLAEGKMALGFALIAFPAKYAVSGIMTFIVNQEGVVYEKDLGEDTAMIASAINIFNPDDSWQRQENR